MLRRHGESNRTDLKGTKSLVLEQVMKVEETKIISDNRSNQVILNSSISLETSTGVLM